MSFPFPHRTPACKPACPWGGHHGMKEEWMKSNQFLSVPPSGWSSHTKFLWKPGDYEIAFSFSFLVVKLEKKAPWAAMDNPFQRFRDSGKKQEHSKSRDAKGSLAAKTRTSRAGTPNCAHCISILIPTPHLKFSKSKSISNLPPFSPNRAPPWFLYFSNGIIYHFASGQGLILRNHHLHISSFSPMIRLFLNRTVILVSSYHPS